MTGRVIAQALGAGHISGTSVAVIVVLVVIGVLLSLFIARIVGRVIVLVVVVALSVAVWQQHVGVQHSFSAQMPDPGHVSRLQRRGHGL